MSPDTTLISGSMAYPEGETAFCLGVSCALFLFILIVVLTYALGAAPSGGDGV